MIPYHYKKNLLEPIFNAIYCSGGKAICGDRPA